MTISGFDGEFSDIPDYIIKITERIWEDRGVGLIRKWYAADCVVHGSGGPSVGAEASVAATLETLNMLPDRRLLPEDIIWSQDAPEIFLSSHRLICPGHHRGAGDLGAPTENAVAVRAIADCLCRGNQVVEEWLVRDIAGLVLQIGADPEAVAGRRAARDAAAGVPAWQTEPRAQLLREGAFRPPVLAHHPAAQLVRETLAALWHGDLQLVSERYHRACSLHAPGFRTVYGHDGVWDVMFGYLAAFPDAHIVIEHSIARDDPGLPTRVATRWWMAGTHTGHGRFGPPSGAEVLILGINHAHVVDGRIREEWMLVDELALRTQIARKRG